MKKYQLEEVVLFESIDDVNDKTILKNLLRYPYLTVKWIIKRSISINHFEKDMDKGVIKYTLKYLFARKKLIKELLERTEYELTEANPGAKHARINPYT